MTAPFEAKFKMTKWEDTAIADSGDAMSSAVLRGTLSGDFEGTTVSGLVMSKRTDCDGTVFDGHARFDGTFQGKEGTFIARDYGNIAGGRIKGTWEIIVGTGTGKLAQVKGSATYDLADCGSSADEPVLFKFQLGCALADAK